jgi:cytoskeleton protein RodZ
MNKKTITAENSKQNDELSEDMEMVGPGQILSEARTKASMTIGDVAKILKFKERLVENIEKDIFDQKLPATYNRGYLKSYAKLINADINEVLSAYDMLGVAEVQRSEMLSFSNLTEKQAEHSRLMWLTYFIAAILFGLMILWWQQEPKQTIDENITDKQPDLAIPTSKSEMKKEAETLSLDDDVEITELDTGELTLEPALEKIAEKVSSSTNELIDQEEQVVTSIDSVDGTVALDVTEDVLLVENATPIAEISTAIFTFSGDCWVNIYDANGERIAWGVKKSGYVMNITGEAPLKVTLGKPELAIIEFNGQAIDMSGFNAGNIAKFTLPLTL